MKRVAVVLAILVVGGGLAYAAFGQGDDPGDGSAKRTKAERKKSKEGSKVKRSGNASDDEYEQIEAAVSAEYTESYVANVNVDGANATATMADGTKVPLKLENGEWVPRVDAPDATVPEGDVPETSAPQVDTPQVETPQVQQPATPSTPAGP